MKIILVTLVLFSFSSCLHAGDRVGNGGDRDEILVKSVMQSLLNYISSPANQSIFPEINIDQLKTIVNETKVKIVEGDLLDYEGRLRTAINQPENKIIYFNRGLFTSIREDSKLVVPLVLHETLGVLGAERSGDYIISSRIIQAALKIYQDAVSSTSDIYFLTGDALKNPIPFWKASVKTYYTGEFVSGIVARPFLLISDKVKMVINQGQVLQRADENISNQTANDTFIRGIFINNMNKALSYTRTNDNSSWEKNVINEVALDLDNLSVHLLDFNNNVEFKNDFVSGRFSKLAFYQNGKFFAGWCDSDDCIFQFSSNQAAIKYLEAYPKEGYKVAFIKDIVLPVVGRRLPMKILGSVSSKYNGYPEAHLNENLEVSWGSVNGYYVIKGEKFKIEHLDLESSQSGLYRRFKFFGAPNFANIQILANSEGAAAFCKDQNSNDRPYLDGSNIEDVYFSGERTFYDYAKSEFITFNSGPVKVLKKLGCSDTDKIDINDIIEMK